MLMRVAIVLALTAVGLSSALAAEHSFLGGSSPPNIGTPVETSRGSAVVTGTLGSMGITTIPGGGGQGFLMNNGNGTSTLIVPGGTPQVVPTPK
jgi:hypothetical protein